MLTPRFAHVDRPLAPHDVPSAWEIAPLLVLALLGLVFLRGRRRRHHRAAHGFGRARAFWLGLGALALALGSPVNALSHALASAHMVQHVLLIAAVAPLFAAAAPGPALLVGLPTAVAKTFATLRARCVLNPVKAALRNPAAVWLAHVVAVWAWHSAALYGTALRHPGVHALEHASLLGTALLLWRAALRPAGDRGAGYGSGLLLLFGTAMQGVLLALLLTFAHQPWYAGYAGTSGAFGLDPLADQRLAGVIMWVPTGAVYLGAALWLLHAWLDTADREPPLRRRPLPSGRRG